MAKRRSTPARPRDLNQLAAHIGALATHQIEEDEPVPVNPSAQKRGRARAEKLTPEERKKIAQKAARARWDKG